MRRTAGLVLFLLLAGCAGKGAGTTGVGAGHLDQQFAAAATTGAGASQTGLGTLEGTVVDDGNLTLPGAGLSLLGTQSYATSGKQGEFRFAGLKPDIYSLRVQASGFQVYEGKVTVEAGQITKATVTMLPNDGRGPGYRPHLHDYWGRDTEIALMDDDVDLRQEPIGTTTDPTLYSNEASVLYGNDNWTFQIAVPTDRSDGRPPTVLPGTSAMQVTLTWDQADVKVPQFGLGYATAATYKVLYQHPHASGEPYIIPLAPNEADSGHQGFTLWHFLVYTGNTYASPTTFTPDLIRGPIHLKILLEKGPVPVDPPHPDRWQANATLTLRSFNVVFDPAYTCACETHSQTPIYPEDKSIVPPGTARMHLKFSWTDKQAPGTLDGNWGLKWRPANLDPARTPFSAYKSADPTKALGNVKEYDFAVAGLETDAFYQSKSNWAFAPYDIDNADKPEALTDAYHTFRLEITVTKDPSFA